MVNKMFEALLTPEQLAQLATIRDKVLEAFNSSNEDLGTSLLALAREVRTNPENPVALDRGTYPSTFLWHIVPELAARLNSTVELSDEEVSSSEFLYLSDYELRMQIGCYLKNIGLDYRTVASSLLTREACNGNLVAIAIDRLCPGTISAQEDVLAQSLACIARTRGTRYDGVWTPAILLSEPAH